MSVRAETKLPSDEELEVQEIKLTTCYMKAAALHVGKYCDDPGKEFMLCKKEEKDPRKCLNEGKAVTSCALEFFRRLKSSCYEEFDNYGKCINYGSQTFEFRKCRPEQAIYDKCVFDKIGLERPEPGYFSKPRIHESKYRPKPEEKKIEYPDQPAELPEDYPRHPAKYGSRFFFNT